MEGLTPVILCVVLMILMLNVGLPIAYAVGFSAMIVGFFTYGAVALEKLGWTTFQTLFIPAWTPLPLFCFIGFLIAQTKIGEDLFRAARAWLSRVPGALVVSTVLAEAGVAATLGSSAATILTVGPVAMPELERLSYDRKMSLGALTCGGVLGPLIPPSATAIIIAGLAGAVVPLGRLLIAGIVPGLLLAVLLSIVPIVKCARNPSLGPAPGRVTWSERFSSLRRVWPVLVIFFSILGSIFFGIATATEAGGVGAFIVMIIAIFVYGLKARDIYRAAIDTVKVNAAILFIIVGASFFSYIIGSGSLSKQLIGWVEVLGAEPILVVICIQVLLLILGCLIDGMTIMVITIPIFLPLAVSMGLNPLWFAVLYEVNMEIALITPPMAINFFLVRNVFKISSSDLFEGVLPYLAVLVIFLFILVAFPPLSIWLPGLMIGK
ncbi:MAG: TRAP transporter large permease [Thermodesulfobacteriota bacterium]